MNKKIEEALQLEALDDDIAAATLAMHRSGRDAEDALADMIQLYAMTRRRQYKMLTRVAEMSTPSEWAEVIAAGDVAMTPMERAFAASQMRVNDLMNEAHGASRSKGWYDGPPRNIGEMIALIHSEASEALEDWRDGNMKTTLDGKGKPVGFPTELADIMIRVADLAGYLGIDLAHEIRFKMDYNKTRPYRHGNKVA